ncbi:MAG: hypothetical protein HN341_18745 [Verrucomicrobia bacterium]|nr:hypothetical protein [Verrucomicrobiota bacterium]
MSKKIKRSISADRFPRMVEDTAFLVDRVYMDRGELDLRLRDNYFNLYYKGNSMAKVTVMPAGKGYEVSIHSKFTIAADGKQDLRGLTGYDRKVVKASELRKVLSKQALDRIASRIKRVNWGEEVTFEQMLITDNPPTPEFIIIDRQVTGGALGRSRLDLLALRPVRVGSSEYKFVILEVKLGNNPELEGKVLTKQLREYIRILDDDLPNFAHCYEKTYCQMHAMRLLGDRLPSEIKIVGPVEGMIVVGGYSRMAKDAIDALRQIKKSQPDSIDERISIWNRPSLLMKASKPL